MKETDGAFGYTVYEITKGPDTITSFAILLIRMTSDEVTQRGCQKDHTGI